MVDGLFLDCAREAAENYPTIEFEEMIVDNTCMQMVKDPSQFDVMLMPSLYGSIIQSLGAGLVGGAGVTAGASFGTKYMMFEPGYISFKYLEHVSQEIHLQGKMKQIQLALSWLQQTC